MSGFAARRERLVAELVAEPRGTALRLGKTTSNLFRDRDEAPRRRLDVREFSHVLEVDPAGGWVDVEGMTPYEKVADATLAHGVMPCVVPQLKSITIGGAVAGVGIEASSFRHGLVHETMLELEVLTGGGEVVVARADNEHRDLFYGFPNSYGTLGYALRVKAKTVPVKPFVRLEHVHHADPESFFGNLAAACASAVDFVDGVVFGPNELVTTVGRFVDTAPYTSDYTYERIYYRSLRSREEDFLSTRDFIWRWDTDWFWCSKNLYAAAPGRAAPARPETPELGLLHEGDALEQPGRSHAVSRPPGRAASRVRDPGHRRADRPRAGVPGFLPARDRHPAGVDLPVSRARSPRCLAALSDSARGAVCQLRILGCRALP